jgi:hypothetical protein
MHLASGPVVEVARTADLFRDEVTGNFHSSLGNSSMPPVHIQTKGLLTVHCLHIICIKHLDPPAQGPGVLVSKAAHVLTLFESMRGSQELSRKQAVGWGRRVA